MPAFPSDEQIRSTAERAQEAFWAVVAQSFPEVRTGDFAPDDTFRFDTACREAVRNWLEGNHPHSPLNDDRD